MIEPAKGPRFLVDGMLGSLAVKLRILGFDTAYDKISNDADLIQVARESGRILVTSDNVFFLQSIRLGVNSILVRDGTESERLASVLIKTGIHSIVPSRGSRCSACNGELSKSEWVSERTIYVCTECGKRYWRGSHWKNLDALFFEVNEILSAKYGSKQNLEKPRRNN